MTKKYQVTLGDGEAKRIKKLSRLCGIPESTLIREMAMRSLPEYEKFWKVY